MKSPVHLRAWLVGLAALIVAAVAVRSWIIPDRVGISSAAPVSDSFSAKSGSGAGGAQEDGKSSGPTDWREGPLWRSGSARPVLERKTPTEFLSELPSWHVGRHVVVRLGGDLPVLAGEVVMNVVRPDGGRSVRLEIGGQFEDTGEPNAEMFGNLDPDGSFTGFVRYREDPGVYRLSRTAGGADLTVRRTAVEDLVCSVDPLRPDGMATPAEALAPVAAAAPVIALPIVPPGSALISVGDVKLAEGQTKGNVMQFPVLSGVASGSGKAAISVQWTLVGTSATSGKDFKAAKGKLSLKAGATQATISVTTMPDRLVEGDETFRVVLSAPVNAGLLKAEGTGTISDDEWSSTITPTVAAELKEPTGDAAKAKAVYAVPFTVSPPVQEAVSFSWKLAAGSATSGKDFTAASGTVKLAAGQGTFTIPVTVLGDGAIEAEESFSIQFSKLPVMIPGSVSVPVVIPAGSTPPVVTEPSPVPLLESKPGAAKVVYLEFTGTTLTGTIWNKSNAPITTSSVFPKFGEDGCREIWAIVAEAYRPFDVNVTTSKGVFNATPTANRTWCLFTSESQKFNSSAAGVGYVDVFGQPTYQPCLAFSTGDYTFDSYASIAVHEIGHNLGLSHDGKNSTEYYSGHEGSRFDWGPWMGTPYYRFYRQFSIGDYAGATRKEDDIALISRYLPKKPDEAGATLVTAADLPLQAAGASPSVTGNITSRDDVDRYRLIVSTGGTVTVKLDADQEGAYSLAPGMKILTEGGAEAVSAGSGWTDNGGSVTWKGTLAAGTYQIDVDGIGDATSPGYSDYGSIGAYTLQATTP